MPDSALTGHLPERLGSPLRGLNPLPDFSAGRILADDPDVGVEEPSTGVDAWHRTNSAETANPPGVILKLAKAEYAKLR